MPATDTPNLGLSHKWNFRETGWHTGMDANLVKLGALVQLAVLDKDLTSPPGAPTAGDRYIVAAGASGAWAGKDGKVALWDGTAWLFYAPAAGWQAWIADEDAFYAHDGSGWVVALGVGAAASLRPLGADRKPAETPNGAVTNFSTPHEYKPGSLAVWLNGVLQDPDADYAEDGDHEGYTFTTAPLSGDVIVHDYERVS